MMLTILMGIHGVRSGHHDDDNIKLPACLPSGSLLLFAIENDLQHGGYFHSCLWLLTRG